MIAIDEVREWVERFDPLDDVRARRSRDATLSLLEREPRPFLRSRFSPGHITASGLVLSTAPAAVLLVFHPRLHRWLQPGGHVEEDDPSIVDAARREVREETGVALGDAREATLVSVDVHDIPAFGGEPAHRHHDLMFCFAVPGPATPPASATLRTAWCPSARLEDFAVDPPLRHAVARALGHADVGP